MLVGVVLAGTSGCLVQQALRVFSLSLTRGAAVQIYNTLPFIQLRAVDAANLIVLPLALPALPQVSFNAEELLHGADAEVYLQRFNPRLVGRDAVINRGMLQVTGLPPVFLATS